MLSVILNYGNMDGRQRLRDGNKMGEAQAIRSLAQYTEKIRDRFRELANSKNSCCLKHTPAVGLCSLR